MFDINDESSLRAAYVLLHTLNADSAEYGASLSSLVATVKREIREFHHRPASNSKIIQDRGIDGYIELVRFPDEIDNVEDAKDWFRANCYLECYPTPYDCSGQKFTHWHKMFRRRGHWYAYHSVSVDV